MSKSAKTKKNTKANETTDSAAASISNSNNTGKPKKSLHYNESVIQVTFPRVTTPDKDKLFSSKKQLKDRRDQYNHAADENYLRALELNLLQGSRQGLSKSKASNAEKDEIRNNNMAHINEFVDGRREFLKKNTPLKIHGTERDVAQVPVEIHYSRQNLDRIDNKKKRGGKKRTRKNRTQRKH
jgi:hypothetical protein